MKIPIKQTAVLAAVLLLAAGCNSAKAPSSSQPAASSQPASPAQSSTYKYVNGTYGFEFEYPTSMVFVNPAYGSLPDQVVQLQISRDAYPKTNFGDADFSASADYAKSLASCLAMPANGAAKAGFKNQQQINGVTFYEEDTTDVGAGNIYNSRVYRTLLGSGAAGGTCLELDETIHTGNIGNYPQGTVTEVDQAPIFQQLDAILNSFKLTK